MRQLLDVGVDVNSKDGSEKANTALHFAATYAGADMIRCLCGKTSVFCAYCICRCLVSCCQNMELT